MKFNDHWCCFVLFVVAGATVYVHGRGARPTLSQCVISDSENVGIFVTDGAQVGNTCTAMFKPSNLDMTDVKFFKMGNWLIHYLTGLRPLMVWDCYLPIAWVASENSRFSSPLAVCQERRLRLRKRNLLRLLQLAYFVKCKRNPLELNSQDQIQVQIGRRFAYSTYCYFYVLFAVAPVAFLGSLSNNDGVGFENVT